MTRMAQMNRELKQARDRKNRQTEGTYRHKESHGLGRPGLVAYISERTRDLLRQKAALMQQEN